MGSVTSNAVVSLSHGWRSVSHICWTMQRKTDRPAPFDGSDWMARREGTEGSDIASTNSVGTPGPLAWVGQPRAAVVRSSRLASSWMTAIATLGWCSTNGTRSHLATRNARTSVLA
jgi:hypothetical protein